MTIQFYGEKHGFASLHPLSARISVIRIEFYQQFYHLLIVPVAEVVYIGTINPYHLEVCKLMLEHGKHVLCEKPLCMNQRDTVAILEVSTFFFIINGFFLPEVIRKYLPRKFQDRLAE